MKSRKMRWAENSVPLGEKRNEYKILIRKHEGHNLEHLEVDEIIIIKRTLKK
jgi:hypothetical protein